MLKITIPETELYDQDKQEFVRFDEEVIQLEHSLASLSKWEEFWEKPFLSDKDKTREETLDYIRCMITSGGTPENLESRLSSSTINEIMVYIQKKATATWFTTETKKVNREIVTSELIYHWMIAHNIPFECQHWHLNRLITLIRVCQEKSEKPKKMSRSEIASRNRSLNAQRRAMLNSNG